MNNQVNDTTLRFARMSRRAEPNATPTPLKPPRPMSFIGSLFLAWRRMSF